MNKMVLSWFIPLLLVIALIASACAGDQVQPPGITPQSPLSEEEKVTITVAAGAVGKELELTQEGARRYMALHPNIILNVLNTPDLVQDRLGLYMQFFQAQSPEVDIFEVDVIWPGDLAEHFVDLYEYGARDVIDQYFPAIVENNTVDGKLVAIPWFTDAGLLYYRTDLMAKYGFSTPPETWQELTDMAQVIQDGERAAGNPDFWGYVWQGNAYEGLTCDALEWISSNGGGDIVSKDRTITINNPLAIEIVEMAAGWVGTISPPGITGFAEEDARHQWQAGNAAFMRNWPYAYSLSNADDSAVKGLFDVAPLPAGKSGQGASALGGWQLSVSKYSRHPEIAADIVLFFAGKEEQKIRAIDGGYNPTIMSLYDDPEVLAAAPFFVSLFDVFMNTVARPSTITAPKYNEVSTLFFNAVHSVISGAKEGPVAFQELETGLIDLLDFKTGVP